MLPHGQFDGALLKALARRLARHTHIVDTICVHSVDGRHTREPVVGPQDASSVVKLETVGDELHAGPCSCRHVGGSQFITPTVHVQPHEVPGRCLVEPKALQVVRMGLALVVLPRLVHPTQRHAELVDRPGRDVGAGKGFGGDPDCGSLPSGRHWGTGCGSGSGDGQGRDWWYQGSGHRQRRCQ